MSDETIGPWPTIEPIVFVPAGQLPEPIRVNPDADKHIEVDLKLTSISGHTFDITTQFKMYTYGGDVTTAQLHYKISTYPFLTSSDGFTAIKMVNIIAIEILNYREII